MFRVIFIVLFSQYFLLEHDVFFQPLCGRLVNPLRWDSFSSEVLWCILNLLLWLHPHPRWAAQVAPESLRVWRAWWGFDVYFAMGDGSLCQKRIGSVSARMNVMQPVTTQRTVLVWNINMHNTTAHKTPHGSVNRNKLCQGDSEDNPDIYGWKWDSQRWPIERCAWKRKARLHSRLWYRLFLWHRRGCISGFMVYLLRLSSFYAAWSSLRRGKMLRKAIDVDYNLNAPQILFVYFIMLMNIITGDF